MHYLCALSDQINAFGACCSRPLAPQYSSGLEPVPGLSAVISISVVVLEY